LWPFRRIPQIALPTPGVHLGQSYQRFLTLPPLLMIKSRPVEGRPAPPIWSSCRGGRKFDQVPWHSANSMRKCVFAGGPAGSSIARAAAFSRIMPSAKPRRSAGIWAQGAVCIAFPRFAPDAGSVAGGMTEADQNPRHIPVHLPFLDPNRRDAEPTCGRRPMSTRHLGPGATAGDSRCRGNRVIGIDRRIRHPSPGASAWSNGPGGRLTLVETAFPTLRGRVPMASPCPTSTSWISASSSMQLDHCMARVFSFRLDGPLDMRIARTGRPRTLCCRHRGTRPNSQHIYIFGEDATLAPSPAPSSPRASELAPSMTTRALADIGRARGACQARRDIIRPRGRSRPCRFSSMKSSISCQSGASPTAERVLNPGGGSRCVVPSLEDRIVRYFHNVRANGQRRIAASSGTRAGAPSFSSPDPAPGHRG